MILLQAMLLGLGGSFHCVGMCGPLALSLPIRAETIWSYWSNVLLYHLGRSFVYAGLGGVMGLLGFSLVLAGYQQQLSIITGVIMLLTIIIPFLPFFQGKYYLSVGNGIKNMLIRQLSNTGSGAFTFGMLNALLPCGLVYTALIGATATGTMLTGMLYMFIFGISTAPLLVGIQLARRIVKPTALRLLSKPIVAIVAILLILRGLNLEIPYISPAFDEPTTKNSRCH